MGTPRQGQAGWGRELMDDVGRGSSTTQHRGFPPHCDPRQVTRVGSAGLGTFCQAVQHPPPRAPWGPRPEAAPPRSWRTSHRSEDFKDFLRKSLEKSPEARWSATQLLQVGGPRPVPTLPVPGGGPQPHPCSSPAPSQHPFVAGVSDKRPLRELVAEARADVLEEEDEEEAPGPSVRE